MTALPTNVTTSVLQSASQQQLAGASLDREHNFAARAAREGTLREIQREDDVVADEGEMTINGEGGGGGQGRSFSEGEGEDTDTTGQGDSNLHGGVTQDSTGQFHVDIEA